MSFKDNRRTCKSADSAAGCPANTFSKQQQLKKQKKERKIHENDHTVIKGLAKANPDFINMNPNRITWNEKREIIFQKKTFYGSKIIHLMPILSQIVTNFHLRHFMGVRL